MKSFLSLFCILSFSTISFGQNDVSKKSFIYIEIGGPATIASINYEYTFFKKDKFSINGRLGIGSSSIKDFEQKINPDLYIPIGFNASYQFDCSKKNKISADFGIGNTFSSVVFSNTQNNPQRIVNYHGYLSAGMGWHFKQTFFTRLYYTPILENYNSLRHWGSLSIGYTF